MNENNFITEVKKINIELTKTQLNKLQKYYKLLVEWNKKFNLTAITKKEDIYLKHFYDSICLIKTDIINGSKNLCDIGTGAGFPGIVIAIIFENLKITLVESNTKKCKFLIELSKILELQNIDVVNERAEIFANKKMEEFDLVTCRAVSSLQILCEYVAPLLKVNGYFIPLKGKVEEEIQNSKNAFTKLNLKLEKIINYKLPIEESERNILIIKKTNQTNKIYPREYKQILKKPL